MAETVAGLFDTRAEAQRALQNLVDDGFDRAQISVISHNDEGAIVGPTVVQSGGHAPMVLPDGKTAPTGPNAAEGAEAGAVTGTIAGGILGLLVGLGVLAIPGVGVVLAAGPLAAALGTAIGAGVGAATGGLLGALVGMGIPEERAAYYMEGVRRGGTLVVATVPTDRAAHAAAVLSRSGAVDIEQRADHYRATGYTGYRSDAPPYTAEEAHRERATHREAHHEAQAAMAGRSTVIWNPAVERSDTAVRPGEAADLDEEEQRVEPQRTTTPTPAQP